jgi:hypothetical protein
MEMSTEKAMCSYHLRRRLAVAAAVLLALTGCGTSGPATGEWTWAGGSDGANQIGVYGVEGQWTWVGGADIVNQPSVYGAQCRPSATNIPGARYSDLSWIDSSGNLWIFGGVGFDASVVAPEFLSDLWRYQP